MQDYQETNSLKQEFERICFNTPNELRELREPRVKRLKPQDVICTEAYDMYYKVSAIPKPIHWTQKAP